MRRPAATLHARLALVALAFAAFIVALPAAEAQSACSVTVGGVDVTHGGTVEAPQEGMLAYTLAAPSAPVRLDLAVLYAGFRIPVAERDFPPDPGSGPWGGEVSVESIARYGTGLYDVEGTAVLASGESCPIAFQVQVPGAPLQSVLGLVAVGALGVGGAALIGILVQMLLDLNEVRQAVSEFRSNAREARKDAQEALRSAGGTRTAPPPQAGEMVVVAIPRAKPAAGPLPALDPLPPAMEPQFEVAIAKVPQLSHAHERGASPVPDAAGPASPAEAPPAEAAASPRHGKEALPDVGPEDSLAGTGSPTPAEPAGGAVADPAGKAKPGRRRRRA